MSETDFAARFPDLPALQDAVLRWYADHARDLPWRRSPRADDPYAVLVSEVMLQQTQVDRVVPFWRAWLERFPTVAALAQASTADVIRAWDGLGYNLRAVRLKRIAEAVVERHGGKLPSDLDALMALPGIGRYTAGAVACFAFGRNVAVMDTNVRRVLGRVALGESSPSNALAWELAEAALPVGRASPWHQALMDIGATLCAPHAPRCLLCPARPWCAHARSGTSPGGGRGLAERHAPYRTQRKYEGSSRYYRGLVVKALRRLPDGQSVSLTDLGPLVKHSFTPTDLPWLEGVIAGLVRDGLLEAGERDGQRVVRLPR